MSAMTTFGGVSFDPLDPAPGGISIGDIAHALSMLCRGGGHMRHHYSVAQHSLNCMREALARGYGERVALAALLHDGSEAYLSDVIRPLKEHLPLYREAEERLQGMIEEKFLKTPLTPEERQQVRDIDDACLTAEFEALMNGTLQERWRGSAMVCPPVLAARPPRWAERAFLRAFDRLTGGTSADPILVYFAGSIRGGREDAGLYRRIVDACERGGRARVLTAHVADPSVEKLEQNVSDSEICARDEAWLLQADLLVAECSVTSLGVGYELGFAAAMGLPVHVLFRPSAGRLSAMVSGCPGASVHYYETPEEAEALAGRILEEAYDV